MKSFTPVYVPVGVPTFHLESAQRQFDLSAGLLRSIDERFAVPEKMLLSIDDLRAFLDGVSPDLIVLPTPPTCPRCCAALTAPCCSGRCASPSSTGDGCA